MGNIELSNGEINRLKDFFEKVKRLANKFYFQAINYYLFVLLV